MIVCLECGHHNDEALEFCESCGTFLEWKGERQRNRTGELPQQRQDTDELEPVSGGEPRLPAVCPRCGEPGRPGLEYCSRCGRELVRQTTGPPSSRWRPAPVPVARPWWRSPWFVLGVLVAVAAVVAYLLLRPDPAPAAAPQPSVVEQPVVAQPSTPVQPSAPSRPVPPPAAPLEVASVTASSVLDPDGDIIYDPRVTLDGDPATAWNDGVRGTPTGESLRYLFASPVRVTRIDIINGYDKVVPEGDRFEQNARIRVVRIQDDAGEATQQLKDTRELQSITGDFGPTCRITLVVESIYPGNEFEDVALSEITFLGTTEAQDACPPG